MKIDINNIPNVKVRAEWKRENASALSSLPDDSYQRWLDSIFQIMEKELSFFKILFLLDVMNKIETISLNEFISLIKQYEIEIKQHLTLTLIVKLIKYNREDILLYLVKCGLVVQIQDEDDERIPKVLKYIDKIKNMLTLLNDE